MRPFCRKTHVHKIPRFRGGGYFGFWGGGGEVPILFLRARGFFWRKLPGHGNSDHLMSFKERFFHFSFLWFVPGLCRVTEIISEAPFFDFLIFWFLKRVQRRGPKGGVRGPPRLRSGTTKKNMIIGTHMHRVSLFVKAVFLPSEHF